MLTFVVFGIVKMGIFEFSSIMISVFWKQVWNFKQKQRKIRLMIQMEIEKDDDRKGWWRWKRM